MEKAVKFGLGLAIAVVFPIMVGLGIEAFYPKPPINYESCSNLSSTPAELSNCFKESENPVKAYDRNVFFITTILGFVTIAFGSLFSTPQMGPIGPGLVFGGLGTVLFGNARSFNAVDKLWLFLDLLLILVGLILVTMRYLNSMKKGENELKP